MWTEIVCLLQLVTTKKERKGENSREKEEKKEK
jgi:hypothetical protein